MLSGPTILVIGAGSSVDFAMPIGSELATTIAQYLAFTWEHTGRLKTGDPRILAALQRRHQGDAYIPFVEAAQKLASVLPGFSSIDDCLFTHDGDERLRLMGKMAIARIIAEREHASWLRGLWGSADQREEALAQMWGGWAQGLVRILATGLKAQNLLLLFNNLTLVTFNYDRCAETALFHAVRRTFAIDDQEAAKVMANLTVFRPYGTLGQLPWAGRDGEPFGNPGPDLMTLADRIQVYTEDQSERPDLEELRNRIRNSRNIIMLGFGFHPLNMRLLGAVSDSGERPAIFSTLVKEPSPRRTEIMGRIRQAFGVASPKLALDSINCAQLISQYGGQFSE